MLVPSYRPLKITLAKMNKNTAWLRQATGIAPSTLTKINKDDWVALTVLAHICETLNCRIEDVVEFIPSNSSE